MRLNFNTKSSINCLFHNTLKLCKFNNKKNYTPIEYLNLATHSQQRHEYINGEIIPMTGGTPNHNQIALNFSAALNFSLKRQPY